MEKKIVNDLHNLNGKNGEITIHHDWYGNQKLGEFSILLMMEKGLVLN